MGTIQHPSVQVPSEESIGFMYICFQPLDGKQNAKSDSQESKTTYYIIPRPVSFNLPQNKPEVFYRNLTF